MRRIELEWQRQKRDHDLRDFEQWLRAPTSKLKPRVDAERAARKMIREKHDRLR